ncbi:MAG TPA: molybdopterin cofactor-binding domain-containing protein, partial [Chitinophagaceae bacterium]|nr:molybdopterin cofactor-binding domain-containing protein [Chitinophagaceae bacterium]
MKNQLSTDRRKFLKSTGLLSGGLIVSFMMPASAKVMRKFTNADPDALFKPNGYLRIAPDGAVTVTLAHVEMGQGIWTTLPMLIAEELDADWEKIRVEHSPPGKEYVHVFYGVQLTGGSSSTWSEFDRYRMAGATARTLLVQAAAKQWSVPVTECRTENGFVISGDKKLSYGELASAASTMTASAKIELRPSSQWKLIGKGKKRVDAPEKVNGTAKYGIDVKYPGLLTALVAHSPIIGGKVKSFDAAKAKEYPGVKDVVQIPTGVAVLADNLKKKKK